MKKSKLFLVLVIITISNSFAATLDDTTRYSIIYAKGIDTLTVKVGEHIGGKTFAFYIKEDDFKRGEAIGTVIPFSSHGTEFFLSEVKSEEDTITGSVIIVSAKVCADPNVLAYTDDRAGPDENDSDDSSSWPVPLGAAGVLVVLLAATYPWWKRWI